MKILWVSASPIGPASRILGLNYHGSSGTWIQSEYEELRTDDENEIFFICPISTQNPNGLIRKQSDEGVCFGIPFSPKISFGKKLSNNTIKLIEEIITEINPDIIHIWGSESSFTATIAQLLPEFSKVIYIQGLIGIHERYMGYSYVREKQYFGKISLIEKLKDKLRNKYYIQHIAIEQDAISAAQNIITDNIFTKAYCNSFSSPTYYNHFLLPNKKFYEACWRYDYIKKNTLFTIFAANASKGLSQLLKAITIVKKTIPDVKLYVPGPFSLDANGRIDKDHCSTFERWLYNYISNNRLWNNIIFTGKLDVDGMRSHFLSCNAFISPSCMEVHSSSVREAMAVGAPTITSFCGSVIEYVNHGESGLIYRFEEEEILAQYIIDILKNSDLATKLGKNAKLALTNKRQQQSLDLMSIYNTIISNRK